MKGFGLNWNVCVHAHTFPPLSPPISLSEKWDVMMLIELMWLMVYAFGILVSTLMKS
jgi:hypothetical protein